jgi:hypothetical protein
MEGLTGAALSETDRVEMMQESLPSRCHGFHMPC